MADDDFETPEIWDEYQWERFLQQQDRNTEKYFGLLEKYLDHPDRDNIIAREMGWESFDEDRDAEWDEVAENLCEEEMSLSQQEPEGQEGRFRRVRQIPNLPGHPQTAYLDKFLAGSRAVPEGSSRKPFDWRPARQFAAQNLPRHSAVTTAPNSG